MRKMLLPVVGVWNAEVMDIIVESSNNDVVPPIERGVMLTAVMVLIPFMRFCPTSSLSK